MRISDWSSDVCSSDLTLYVEPVGTSRLERDVGPAIEQRAKGFHVGPVRTLHHIGPPHVIDHNWHLNRVDEGPQFLEDVRLEIDHHMPTLWQTMCTFREDPKRGVGGKGGLRS